MKVDMRLHCQTISQFHSLQNVIRNKTGRRHDWRMPGAHHLRPLFWCGVWFLFLWLFCLAVALQRQLVFQYACRPASHYDFMTGHYGTVESLRMDGDNAQCLFVHALPIHAGCADDGGDCWWHGGVQSITCFSVYISVWAFHNVCEQSFLFQSSEFFVPLSDRNVDQH